MRIYHSDSGSIFIGIDGDAEEEETDAYEKSIVDRTSHKNLVQSDIEQNPDSAPPATPLSFGRYINSLNFSSKVSFLCFSCYHSTKVADDIIYIYLAL